MTISTKFGAIGQISRYVNDIENAKYWYENVLSLKHLYSFGNMSFFECGDVRLLLKATEDGSTKEDSIIYFRVENMLATCKDLKTKGAQIISAPHMIHNHENGSEEWMAFIEDNEKRPLGLMSLVQSN